MANIWRDIRGILGSIFQLGIGGPNLKNSSGVIQARNAADSGWADVEVENILLHGSNGTYKVILEAPAGMTGDLTLTLPGTTTTIPSSSGMHVSKITSFTQATSSPLTLDAAPPVNGTLAKVRIMVDAAASGGSPTFAVGVSGTPARDMATTENNLKATDQYLVEPMRALGGSPAAIIGTIVVSGQTFVGRVQLEYILA